jgi:hypothetical protein
MTHDELTPRQLRAAAQARMTLHRHPYVGEGVDGARRSAEIDRTEADGLDQLDPRRELLLSSSRAWQLQAVDLLVAEGWTVNGAFAHVEGTCDRAICCGWDQ